MQEGRNIPPLITLTAAMVVCVFCIYKRVQLFTMLKWVLLVMILFYIIGRIVQKIVTKINKDAEEAALQRQREELEQTASQLEKEDAGEAEDDADQ